MRKLLKKWIPNKVLKSINLIRGPFIPRYKKSYSQSGEDMILDTILGNLKSGFYVDIGANNPKVQSNTHFFYKKGWNGINVDALPGSMKIFERMRSRDINLEIPISDIEETKIYYMFEPSFYNSFLHESAILYKDMLIGQRELSTKKLEWIFDNYLNNRVIDFLTIDVEGLDFHVLKSNNWTKYRPKLIVFEQYANEIESVRENPINVFLEDKGYLFYCLTPTNIIYIEQGFRESRFNKN